MAIALVAYKPFVSFFMSDFNCFQCANEEILPVPPDTYRE